MLEIIILIWLSRNIGGLARQKGLRPSTWQIYLVAGWVVAEMIGIVIGLMIFGQKNLVSVLVIGIAFAFSSYFSVRSILEKYPDQNEEDINNIGNNK